jgi:2-alkyl-3-oxoalkanoate reductase
VNVFVTGATGVLGRPVTRMLLDSGHNVRALARSPGNHSRLLTLGAEPIEASLFDPDSLRPAITGCDAVLHLATRIPPSNKMSAPKAWKENDRIRIEGTRNLVSVALQCRVSTFIYPGIVFLYPDRASHWLDAFTPPDPSPVLESSLIAEKEVERFNRSGRRGIVLRMGGFYGPTAKSTKNLLRYARFGVAMIFGRGTAYQPLIWIDDAALAVVDALAKGNSGIYDIVDDEPLQKRELASALADAAGRRWLLRPPRFLLWLFAGQSAMFLTRSQRVSNRRFKDDTGWAPTVPSAAVGLRLCAIQP